MISTVMAPVSSRKTLNNTYRYARGTISVLIDGSETRGTFSLLEVMQMPGSEPPLHVHQHEDETFYVLEGRISVWVGGQVHHLEAGGSIFLPRGVPHTFRVRALNARGRGTSSLPLTLDVPGPRSPTVNAHVRCR